MRANRWDVPRDEGIQLWTVPVAVLAVLMILGGVKSITVPDSGTYPDGREARVAAPHAAVTTGQWISAGEVGGGRAGQRPVAAEQPAGR